VARMERIIRDAMRTRESRAERQQTDRARSDGRATRTRTLLATASEDVGD